MKSCTWRSLFFLVLFPAWVFAASPVIIETNPKDPIKGEVFQILFKCQTEGNTQPEISFDPVGFEVLGKQAQGLSTRTVFSQGKYTTTREILISYDARAAKTGVISLKNLVVKIDGRVERDPSVDIMVLDAPPEPRVVFVAAEVSKKSVYVGEGIIVRYHVFKKTALQSFDIKKYPKLDGFMKRYLQENENPHRVTVDGDLFSKSLIYSVRLYPEKSGKLVIDPMEVSATYAQDIYGNMGFGFGLGMRDMKTRTLSSAPVEIEVRPLPEANRPASFAGLVGPHKFELKPGRNQILVNEPLEARLTITGPGNLENLEAPALWSVPQLEKFDAKSDLGLVGAESAIKTFDYTYLGKQGGQIPALDLELSYFDPDSGRYEKIQEQLPAITVAGNSNPSPIPSVTKKDQEDGATKDDSTISAPGFIVENRWWSQMGLWWGLLIIVVFGALYWRRQAIIEAIQTIRSPLDADLNKLSRGNYAVAELVRVLYRLSPGSPSVQHAIQSSSMTEDEKSYFKNLLNEAESAEFTRAKQGTSIKIDAKMFKSLRKNLKR